jgi:uncharacterized protein YegL
MLRRVLGARVWTLLCLCAVLAWIQSCTGPPPTPIRTAQEGIPLTKAGRPPGMDLFLLMDESGSMYGEGGTDPQQLRYEAAKYLVQNLPVKEADAAQPHRLAIIHFGDAAVSRPLIDLIPGNAEELAQNIAHVGKHLGNTSFIEALKAVKSVAEAAPPSKHTRQRIIAMFTDGEPDDRRRLRLEQYFREIGAFRQQHLSDFQFYVIGIDTTPDRARWAKSRGLWEAEVGRSNVFFITEMRELYAKYNEVIRRIFEIPEVSPDIVTAETAFEVLPYLDRLEFHIFPESKQLKLGIVRPDQRPVQAQDRDVSWRTGEGYDILTIAEPQPGAWKYRILEGKGRIRVHRNPVPFKLRLIEPEDVHPLGKPMLLKAQFAKGGGQAIAAHPDYPLAFTAKAITPKKEEINLQFLMERKIGQCITPIRPSPPRSPAAT